MERYEDPKDELNGPNYLSGLVCIERGCKKPAGTAWSPYWCQECNAKRIRRITANLERMQREDRS